MNEENQNDPNSTPLEIEALETERTLSSHRQCNGCGADLTGRRRAARFCSAKCRTAHHRKRRDGQLADIITALEDAIAALKTFGVRS
jgi:predicted nucleic acid-binding Zn ribbon protein